MRRTKQDLRELFSTDVPPTSFHCRACGTPIFSPAHLLEHSGTCKKTSRFLSIDNARIYVSGTYASGMPRLMIKLNDLTIQMPHKNRAGEPYAAVAYNRACAALIDAGVTW